MRQATLILTLALSLGLFSIVVPAHAEEAVQETDLLQPANEPLQCEEPPVEEPALPEVLQPGAEGRLELIRQCTEQEAALCPTGCGCLFVNNNPCCIGLGAGCATTC